MKSSLEEDGRKQESAATPLLLQLKSSQQVTCKQKSASVFQENLLHGHWNIIPLLIFSQPFKNVRISRALQKQVVGPIWPTGHSLLTSGVGERDYTLDLNKPRIES